MADKKISDYLIYRTVIKKLVISVGLWPLDKPNTFYNLIPYIQIIINVFMCFGMIGYVRANFTNIALVTRGLSIMTSFLSTIVKVGSFVMNRKDAIDLHNTLDLYFNKMLNSKQLPWVILNNITTVRPLTWTFLILVSISCGVRIIDPFSSVISQLSHKISPIKYPLLYPSVFPWSLVPGDTLYNCEFVIELLATMTLWLITMSVDCLFTFYVFQMIGQLREIADCFDNLDGDDDYDCRNIVRKCVNQYQTIIKCRDLLQKIYGPIILWIMVTNAIILCTVAFSATKMDSIPIGKGLILLSYILLKLVQTFMYAWSGSLLMAESEECREAIYAAKWFGNKRLMTAIIIILSQKPLSLTACNFSVVSVDIFQAVVNTTVSYFFLLQTIEPDS
ncbi:odorant receptor 4-like [Microplitis demolitor]|uniref:odorant receptor 4-like n=1 Tax=Microplitis demolitor TaxID=69319 RepID=UPI0004CCE6EE|nr:odorant receptor 4-like [Microplitis demolitor]